jgi:hypothetical protein
MSANSGKGWQEGLPGLRFPSRVFRTAEKGSYRFNSPGKAMGEKLCATRTLRGLSFVRGAPTMEFFCSAISGYPDNSANYFIIADLLFYYYNKKDKG